MWIADFDDYKAFLKGLIATYPKKGRGLSRRLAEHLNVAPVVVSQILARDRHFTPDQAPKVAAFFGLDERATEYFIYLVCRDRADGKELKAFYGEKLARLRADAQKIKHHVQGRDALSETAKGVFYSNWYYSGVRILSSIDGFQTTERIAEYFGLSRSKVGEIIAFLVETGLCVQDEGGRIVRGPKSTHVDDKSPFVNNPRRNWRDTAREKFGSPGTEDLFYSSPVALSKKDAELFRKELLKLIKDFSKQVADSPEETTMCLNIDWFKF
jgi:uncharacterized protein (TIGR02147 family)